MMIKELMEQNRKSFKCLQSWITCGERIRNSLQWEFKSDISLILPFESKRNPITVNDYHESL
jgi:hypothetical protein